MSSRSTVEHSKSTETLGPRDGCILVTGASSGIGLATAVALSSSGHRVLAVSRHPSPAIDETGGPNEARSPLTLAADLTLPDEVDRVFTYCEAQLGGVLSVLHSVGHDYEVQWLSATEPEAIIAAVSALLTSPALVLARALRSMEATGGSVGLVSSGAAVKPTPGRSLYSASKAAVNRMVESVSLECADRMPGIAVFAVSPGRVDTPMQRRLMMRAQTAPATFRLESFKSGQHVHPAAEVGAALADLILAPPQPLNGKLATYRESGWHIEALGGK